MIFILLIGTKKGEAYRGNLESSQGKVKGEKIKERAECSKK